MSLGLALRWGDRFGIGVDGRLGLGASQERAVLVSAQLDLFFLIVIATLKTGCVSGRRAPR